MSIKQTLNNIKDAVSWRIGAYAAPVLIIIVEIVIAILCIVKAGTLPTPWWYYFLLIGASIQLIACIKEDLKKTEDAEQLKKWYKLFYILAAFGDFIQKMLYTILGVVN